MSAQNVTVTLQDGTTHAVAIDNPDRIRWDLTRAKQNWPKFDEAVFLGLTFMAWNNLRRTGRYKEKFDHFMEDCIELEPHDDEDEAGDLALPPVIPSATA